MNKNIYSVNGLDYESNCTSINIRKWEKLMQKSVKANGSKIRALIKTHLPDLYEYLALEFFNPYESQSVRTKTHFIYVHSGIEYFLKFN
jgi:hypothetical protein